MNADDKTTPCRHTPEDLTPEEARERRAYHLALLRTYAEAERGSEAEQVDAADSTMATFILPGD